MRNNALLPGPRPSNRKMDTLHNHMNATILTHETLSELANLQTAAPWCLSLYQPTHRRHPENKQDPIRFGNLAKNAEQSLKAKYPGAEVRSLLNELDALGKDHEFWNHTLDGLALFGGPEMLQVFRLPREMPELVVLADSFHTKPLRRLVQSADRYQILGLSRQKIQLFEGSRDAIDLIELAPGVPRTITEALGDELTDSHETVAAHGGTGGGSAATHHGHGGKKSEVEIDETRFFRVVDSAVLAHHSKRSGLPLMLAALPEHHSLFHQISHNPSLLAEGLKVNPEFLSQEELRERAWQVFEPQYQARLAKLAADFATAKAAGLGLEDLARVAEAASAGRVAALLIEADRQIAGRLNPATGHVDFKESKASQADDLLDDLGELVLRKGGSVTVLPSGKMPSKTGAAALCRY